MEIRIKELDGIEIRIDEDSGKFIATLDGREVSRSKLSEMEKLITSQRKALTVYDIDTWYSHRGIHKTEIIGFNADGNVLLKSGAKGKYGSFFILTDNQKSEFERLTALQEKINNDWSNLTQKLRRVNKQNFHELMDKQGNK